MLILRRKKNESILIGDNIRITVVESASDGVRLAIDAPKQISILREELSIAEQENKNASSPHLTAITGLQDSLKHITFKKNKPTEAAADKPDEAADKAAEDAKDKPAETEAKAEIKADANSNKENSKS
ncbi:carbon storage regulator, CsrA [Oribacterium sp. KHPX15]|nr:carbon storage regulator [Oribacterium sp. KHPX15]SEA42852.1 carbon storage regulator, CsrA [Oribacterium sp. KHPX15]